jgi:hypothetical protein
MSDTSIFVGAESGGANPQNLELSRAAMSGSPTSRTHEIFAVRQPDNQSQRGILGGLLG